MVNQRFIQNLCFVPFFPCSTTVSKHEVNGIIYIYIYIKTIK